MWSPEFNKAIVEYTAAIPEAKAKPAVPSIYILFHKLISVRCCSGYKYFYLSLQQMTHACLLHLQIQKS
jgi:hypothetical protein